MNQLVGCDMECRCHCAHEPKSDIDLAREALRAASDAARKSKLDDAHQYVNIAHAYLQMHVTA